MALRLFAMLIYIVYGAMEADAARNDPEKQARSVHLFYGPQAKLPESAMVTLKVKETFENSFFMAIGWESGYFGLQDWHDYNIFIFSIWEPGNPHDYEAKEGDVKEENRARIVYAAENVLTERFEHEGTGAKAYGDIAWKVGEPISFRVDAEPDGDDRMIFTGYVKMRDEKDWYKLASISTICKDPEVRGVCNVYSFVEDFWRNGESAKASRTAEFSDIKTREKGSDKWVKANMARFTADATRTNNIDAGPTGDGAAFLKTGGATTNEHVKLWHTFSF